MTPRLSAKSVKRWAIDRCALAAAAVAALSAAASSSAIRRDNS